MRMPGFTAETALYRTAARWRAEGAAAAGGGELRVTPQYCYTSPGGNYTTCCYCAYGYCFCNTIRHHVLM